MKKMLFTMLAVATSSAALAQSPLVSTNKADLYKNAKLAEKQLMFDAKKSSSLVSGIKKSVANGVYYTAPLGSYHLSSMNYDYLIVPPFTPVEYKNMCNNPATAKWNVNGNAVAGNDANDFVASYQSCIGQYLMYAPTITSGASSFTFGDDAANTLEQAGIITMDGIGSISINSMAVGSSYYGFGTGENCFGTGTTQFDFDGDGVQEEVICDGLRQYYHKPMSPLYVQDFFAPIASSLANPLPDGKKLTMTIYGTEIVDSEDGGTEVIPNESDVIARFEADANSLVDFEYNKNIKKYVGLIFFQNLTQDEFGSDVVIPTVINQDFFVTITGFAQDGVDVGLYLCDMGGSADYETHSPTMQQYYSMETGDPLGYLFSKGASGSKKYCYNAHIYMDAVFDVAQVDDSYNLNTQIAPVEGGVTSAADFEADGQVYTEQPAYVKIAMPWMDDMGEETGNYTIVDADNMESLPDWIEYYEVSENREENAGLVFVKFGVAKLPEGVTGRSAKLILKGAHGVDAEVPFYVVQGDVNTGIEGVEATNTTGKQHKGVYNIAGQRLNKDANGLLIKNGKKVFVK